MIAFVAFLLHLNVLHTTYAETRPLILPQGTGSYYTSLINEEWVDQSRLDPFNSSHVRRIMITRFDPVPRSHCNLINVPYTTPATAAVEDEILGEYDYPKGLWARFYLQACSPKYGRRGNVERGGKTKFPLALFSAGLNTTRTFSNHIAQEIASHGFTVITMDHPYDTDVVEFPNGDVILGGYVTKPADANGSTASVEHALEVRADDASFVLDELGVTENALMFGQSFGGAASATALLNDKRFRAGVNNDGMMFGPVLNRSLGTRSHQQAFMLWGSEGHDSSTDPTWTQFWNTLSNSPYVDHRKEFTIKNSSHASYWDLNILVDVAGIKDELSDTAKSLLSSVPGARVEKILGRYFSAFFWYTLGLKPEGEILRGSSKEFPEVQFLHV